MIDINELKSCLEYNQDTGIFTWIKSKRKSIIGKVAGSPDRHGYIDINVHGVRSKAHKFAWLYVYGEWPDEIDHINGVKYDNRISNLRKCTKSQNMKNRKIQKNNKTGYVGVCFDNTCNRYRATAKLNGKKFHLGMYKTAIEASEAYVEFAKKNHGEFLYHGHVQKVSGERQ